MALEGKLESEIEIKASADKFYNVFRREMHLIPNVSSEKLHSVEIHEGDWHTLGSVKHWNYNLDETPLSLKETVETVDEETVDEENRSITFNIVEGEVLSHYKVFKATVQVTPKEDEGCLVKWTFDYKKLNDDISDPNAYVDLAIHVTHTLEAHLLDL